MVSDEPLPPLARSALQPLSLSLSLACIAGYLYHQKDMLQDRGRMDGYRNAILQNPGCFKDKVVLDVGTGSGVLAIWAAMAGAKRVYAVEATSMAQQAPARAVHLLALEVARAYEAEPEPEPEPKPRAWT